MTVRWTVKAAEPTAAFSPQRKGKTGGSNPPSATKEKPLTYKCSKLLSQRLSFSLDCFCFRVLLQCR